MSEKVMGNCPMGCGDTLFLGSGGYVTCSWHKCPDPGAVADLLLDHSTPNHIVVIGSPHHPRPFSIQHPLRERLRGELFECPLHEHLNTLSGPPRQPGRYRVIEQGDVSRWLWVRTDVSFLAALAAGVPKPPAPEHAEAAS